MQDFRSSPALRLLGRYSTAGVDTASGDDLANLDTTNLPDNALAWGADTLFALNRDSTQTPVSYSNGDGLIVAPISGPGRWIAVMGRGIDRLGVELTAGNFVTDVVVSAPNTWSALADHNWLFTGLDPVWTVTANGVITYNGPPIDFDILFAGTFVNAIGTGQTVIAAYPSVNGALLGTTTDQVNESRVASVLEGAIHGETQLVNIEQRQLSPGDTLQTLFRSVNGDNFTLVRAKLMLTPVSPRLT